MKFRNPQNGYVEEVEYPLVWLFLFGGLYLLAKGVYRHAILYVAIPGCFSTVIMMIDGNTKYFKGVYFFGLFLTWVVYFLIGQNLIRINFLRMGWVDVDAES